jgi:hypothetical protein
MPLIDDIDLDLCELPRVGPGRQASEISAEFVRELTEADLLSPVAQTQFALSIKKIRDSHHALARVLATGSSEAEASLITGYSPSRISILKADPQFQDLLEFYRNQAKEVTADFRARMALTGMTALAELQERLEEEPEKISTALMKDIVKDLADRTGHAPNSGSKPGVNVNINLSDNMANARARVEAFKAQRTIEHE